MTVMQAALLVLPDAFNSRSCICQLTSSTFSSSYSLHVRRIILLERSGFVQWKTEIVPELQLTYDWEASMMGGTLVDWVIAVVLIRS